MINTEYCKRSGFSSDIRSYLDGPSALEAFAKNNDWSEYDHIVVFLDLFMPEMNGLEFLNEFQKGEYEWADKAEFFILTSSINRKDKEESLKHPLVSDFMSKPIDIELLNTLKSRLKKEQS